MSNNNGSTIPVYEGPVISVKEDEDRFLSEIDLLRIELSQAKLELAAATAREHRLLDKIDEIECERQQLKLQVQAHEMTIGRWKRLRESEAKIKLSDTVHESKGKKHEELKTELGQKYKVTDWTKVAYDDLTGRISPLPEATPEKGN